MKNTLLFICGTNILVRLLTVNMKDCLTPKNPKKCDPFLVTLLKMRPHYCQSSRENVTPSSGTSPLASNGKYTPRGIAPSCQTAMVSNVIWLELIQSACEKEQAVIFLVSESRDISTFAGPDGLPCYNCLPLVL